MNTTTITVSANQLWLLANHCAKKIHAAVVTRHVVLTGSSGNEWQKEEIQEIRALIRSLPDERYGARRDFVVTIKYLFQKLREERGTEPRWQDYIAKVRQFHPDHITAECEAKLRLSAA